MVGLGRETPNTLTGYQSNAATKKIDVKNQLIAEAQAASSKDNIVAPEITMNADTQNKADRQNTARLAEIGVKEVIAAAITSIVPSCRTTEPCSTFDQTHKRV